MPKAIPEISVDAKLLHQALRAVAIGGVISWAQLRDVIGREVRAGQKGYGALQTARHRALRDDNMVFAAVHGEGLKRLTDEEIVETGADTVKRVRRIARKGAEKLLAVADFDALPNAAKIRHNAYTSMCGALTAIATERKVEVLEKNVTNAKAALPVAKALELFK